MTLDAARQWLESHSTILPALRVLHQQALDSVNDTQSTSSLSALIDVDPGLSLALLQTVNSARGDNSQKEPIDSTTAAIALIGESTTTRLLQQHPVMEAEIKDPDQLFLLKQIINRSQHNELQASRWASIAGYQQLEPLRLAGRLAYIGEALCCAQDFATYRRILAAEVGVNPQRDSVDFNFDELSAALLDQVNLPDLLRHALPGNEHGDPRARLVRNLSRICRESENGWYSQAMTGLIQQLAEFVQLAQEHAAQLIHQHALQAAHQSPVADAWQPAARLVLISDQHWLLGLEPGAAPKQQAPQKEPKPTRPAAGRETARPSVTRERLVALLKNSDTTLMNLLRAAIQGIRQDVALSRICLLLLSKDKKHIKTRLADGLDPDSALNRCEVDIEHSRLFKVLLEKPQALWVQPSSYPKYEKLLADSFKAATLTQDFFTMSLFIGDKPIGILFADCKGKGSELEKEQFTYFKQLVLLSSKALASQGKKR